MGTNNKYIGNRYVPKHCGTWDNITKPAYESLSVVLWEGNSYTSRKNVPDGIDIMNIAYWVKSADYNEQLSIYQNDIDNYNIYLTEQLGIIDTNLDIVNSQLADIVQVNVRDFNNNLQQAHDYLTTNFDRGILLIPHDITITDTFTWDVAKVSIKGNGAKIIVDINDITKYAIKTISSETANPYNQATTTYKGIKLICKVAKSCKGILYDGIIGTGNNGASHISLSEMTINGFITGETYGNHAYCINHYACDELNNTAAIDILSTSLDTGERISYTNCTVFNNTLAIKQALANSDLYFINCSLDYNGKLIQNVNGKTFFSQCHIENRGNENIELIELSGNGSMISIDGGWLLFTGSTFNIPHVFVNNATSKGGLFINNMFINNFKTTSGYLATGTGRTLITNSKGYAIFDNTLMVHKDINMLMDGGFELSKIVDDIFITRDTETIVGRPLIGANVKISQSSDIFRSGSKALKIQKMFGAGSVSEMNILIPLNGKNLINLEFYYAKVGVGGGNFSIVTRFVKQDSNNNVNVETIGVFTVTLPTNTLNFTKYASGSDMKFIPLWATHIQITINLDGFNAIGDSIFLDDILVNEM